MLAISRGSSNYEKSVDENIADCRAITYMGVARIFQKGGGGGGRSHCVKQRVLAFSQPEYCRLFALKKAYKGGGGVVYGHPRTPLPLTTPLT